MKYQSEVSDVYFYVLGYRSSKAAAIVPEWMGKYLHHDLKYILVILLWAALQDF